jgi:sugar phosphate isomerase/epimerase
MIELGIDAFCWHSRIAAKEVGLLDVIDAAAELEVPYVNVALVYVREVDGGADAVLARAEAHGLDLQAHGAPIGRPYFDGNLDRATKAVGDWLRESEQLGSPNVEVHSGIYRPELTAEPDSYFEELDFLRRVLHGAADVAAETGVELLFENASDFKSFELVTLFEGAESLPLGMFIDITNPLNVFEDPVDAIERLAPFAPTGHIKDFVLSSNWTEDHYHRRGYTVEFRYPGEGVTDTPRQVAKLAEVKGDEKFRLSIEGLDSHAGVDDQVERLRRSLHWVRGCVEQAAQGSAP